MRSLKIPFVKSLILQYDKIEELVRESDVYEFARAEAIDREKKLNKERKKLVNINELLRPQDYNDIEIMIMQFTSSLTEFLYFYEKYDLYEVYKMITKKMAIDINKEIDG